MRRFFWAGVAVFLVLAGFSLSQERKGPRISVVEPNFDFGFAPEGAVMVHEYVIRNIGDEDLVIKRVRTTCGCATAPVKKTVLAPGEETTVTIIFNSTRYFHKTSKAAIISTNDPERPSEKITFVADMDTTKPRAITAKPRILDVGRGEEFRRENTVKIYNLTDDTLTLAVVDYYREFLDEPKLSSVSLPPKGTTDVKVSIRREVPASDVIKASFTVAAMDKMGKQVTRITVPVMGGGS